MMDTNLLTIILLQRNHISLTKDCLLSLKETNPAGWHVLVVDDGSHEDELQSFDANCYDNLELITQPYRGITAAWNRGIAESSAPFLLFLNNDVVFHGAVIERLLEPLLLEQALITGVRLRREQELPLEEVAHLPAKQVLEGWCFAVSRSHLKLVSEFDQEFKVYFSDTDFQLRLLQATRNDVSSLHAIPTLPAEHLEHRTMQHDPFRRTIWEQDRQIFRQKWRLD